MTFYERKDLDRLKSQVSLSDYLTRTGVSLLRAGRLLRTNCPLHEDSTPSFYVKDDQSYYCYGCQSGGDIFTLTQKLYDISFSDAVARVQEYAGGGSAPVSRPLIKSATKRSALALSDSSLLEQVVSHYHQKLGSSQKAQDYLSSRKISEDVVTRFEIGFATGFLSKKIGNRDQQLRKLGLINSKGSDSFYQRLTLPIRASSKVIRQLYGRSLTDKNKHRYLPFAHSTLFNSDALSEPKVILCESILDALSFHSHGFENAIAVYSAGGLKPEFVRQLAESSVRKVMIAYDSDKAGDAGALRAAKLLRESGILPYRLGLPPGMDVNALVMQSNKPADTLERLIKDSSEDRM